MRVLLFAYDNESYVQFFPTGLAYIASSLRRKGVDVCIYNQDVHHYPDSHITEFLDKNRFDILGYGTIAGYYQYRKLLSAAQAINKSKHRPFFVLGGHGPSPEPEFFMQKTGADAVVVGEGEETILELLDTISSKGDLSKVKGIAYREGRKIILNQRRPLINDVDSIPMPAYDMFPMLYYRMLRAPNCRKTDFVMPMISGRGCPFKCAFCYRLDQGFRPRSPESIIEEISYLKQQFSVNYILFEDELLMSSVPRTEKICKALIDSGLGIRWCCNGRLNYADKALMKLMKKAGCVFINYGIESMDDKVLEMMDKHLTVKQIKKGIEETLSAGISPGFNIIFGNIGDNRQTLRKGCNFLLKYDDGAQLRTIRPVTPYPGCPLYYEALRRGLLKDVEDFYENKHKNSDLLSVNFTKLTDHQFHMALKDANKKLISNYYSKLSKKNIEDAERLYSLKDSSFRGFRQL